jgi:hypothetical protein
MEYPPGYSELFVQRLNEINNNLNYAWLAFVAIRDEEVGALISRRPPIIVDDILGIPCNEHLAYARSEPNTADRFIWFVLRGALITLYEAFKEDNARFKGVENQDWFLLLASLRHSLSHGIEGKWRRIFCNDGDRLRFTRRCDGKEFVLSKNLIGQGIDFSTFGSLPTAMDLFPTAIEFAKNVLPRTM